MPEPLQVEVRFAEPAPTLGEIVWHRFWLLVVRDLSWEIAGLGNLVRWLWRSVRRA